MSSSDTFPTTLTVGQLRPVALQYELQQHNRGMKRLLIGFGLAALPTSVPRFFSPNTSEALFFMMGNAVLLAGIFGWYFYERRTLIRRHASPSLRP